MRETTRFPNGTEKYPPQVYVHIIDFLDKQHRWAALT